MSAQEHRSTATTAQHQRLRLRRTLSAGIAALFLNFTTWALLEHGLMRMDAGLFAVFTLVLWTVNAIFVAIIASGANLRFRDPSLTLPQILWATTTLFVVAYHLDSHRHIILFFSMLIMLFGVFRLRFAGFLIVAAYTGAGYGAVIMLLQVNQPASIDFGAELISWVTFCTVLLMFSLLGNDLSQIRQALSQRNAELRASRDAASAASAAKSNLLATVSHEIRTPLNSIQGMLELLSETTLGDEQRDYVTTGRRSGVHLLSLVERMLSISSIENDGTPLRERPVELDELLGESCDILAGGAREKGLDLTWHRDPRLPAWITADGDRIREVLLNLIGNAVKFTTQGRIELRATRASSPGAGELSECIEFRVTDTGPGISAADLEQVFEPFFQADLSITRQVGGAGLGLAVSKRQAEKMGGTIGAISEPQRGSIFWMRLPLRAEQPTNTLLFPSQAPCVASPGDKPPRRLLLVDDSEDNRLLVRAYLKVEAYEIDEACDGAEALVRFETGEYDVVLMDLHMPVMDGLEATRRIRTWETSHARRRTPIVALTADAITLDANGTMAAGCDAHLTKPVSRTTLLTTLEGFVRHPPPTAINDAAAC